ncbi:MAG: peptidoglycan editing factor PgeF [Candidatus Marinimicrobia bacterium]|nr:peptidoglycan editing factor PgeF [Candidatus Neomarinimicrobiota bacterium]MBL7066823.1 peptidoglycan editing factor PgeF [Candidatus Neomarinimicrobiota bacterium]
MFNAVHINDLIVYQSSLLNSWNGICHGFSTRAGGVSNSPHNTLNLGLSVGDTPENVHKNRKLFFQALKSDPQQFAQGVQVHGNTIQIVDHPDTFESTDALITIRKNIPLVIKTADCTPVILFEPEQRVVAAVHAGWRSVVRGILKNTIRTMVRDFNCNPENIKCATGPSIRSCCYEVKSDVSSRFPDDVLVRHNSNEYLDIPKAIQLRLIDQGIQIENIDDSQLCTACNEKLFFSHRREKGKTGRMMMAVYLT